MTTDDRSPMLSQPADADNAQRDLSPMIGGRGAKIIVSARGAYVARNLYALVEMLDETHQHSFRVEVTRHLRETVLSLSGSREISPIVVMCLAAADRWLEHGEVDPLVDAVQAMQAAGELVEIMPPAEGARLGAYQGNGAGESMTMLGLIYCMTERDACNIPNLAVVTLLSAELDAHPEFDIFEDVESGNMIQASIDAIETWMIETAWRLLGEQSVPI